jgi:hypothetical protein
VIKPAEGTFDDAFALDAGARRAALIRSDGETFAKLEIVDLATGATASSWDLPRELRSVERLELLPEGKGVLLIARQPAPRPEPGVPPPPPRFSAAVVDAAGRLVAMTGPAAAFGSRPGSPLLVALDRDDLRSDVGTAGTTYTLTPLELPTLAPAGKPRVYRADAGGDMASPPFRILGFCDGYTRALGERPGGRRGVLDTLTGKITDEAEIGDALGWARAARLRADHPDRGRFATLNPDRAGVDIVDEMGNSRPAALAIPFSLYDPTSLRDQEGPERGALYFSVAVDPLNAEAVKRRKPDLPMLDLYASSGGGARTKLRGRVFIPRPVTWKAGYDNLVVLKRAKKPARGGDELQVYRLD